MCYAGTDRTDTNKTCQEWEKKNKTKKANRQNSNWQLEKCSGDFRRPLEGEEGNHISNVPVYLDGGGAFFFLLLLFVTPLKMYMGITSKLVNRKHPLAIFWGVRYIVRYKCTRDVWNTTKPPCTLFSLLQKTFFVMCCFILFFFLHLSFFFSCDKNKCRERLLSP